MHMYFVWQGHDSKRKIGVSLQGNDDFTTESLKKTLDFLFFKAEHPDSSLMIQVLIPLPIRFIRVRPTGCITGLNTGCITALDMCEVCTEAVHSVAL